MPDKIQLAGLLAMISVLAFSLPAKTQPQPTAACANPSLTVSTNVAFSRPRAVVVDALPQKSEIIPGNSQYRER
jgi:hypothetical protein